MVKWNRYIKQGEFFCARPVTIVQGTYDVALWKPGVIISIAPFLHSQDRNDMIIRIDGIECGYLTVEYSEKTRKYFGRGGFKLLNGEAHAIMVHFDNVYGNQFRVEVFSAHEFDKQYRDIWV